MRQYPVWLLILLAPTILVPVGTLVFFLFGNVLLWPESISFFVSLFFWGWARERSAIYTAIGGLLLTAASICVLALQ